MKNPERELGRLVAEPAAERTPDMAQLVFSFNESLITEGVE